MKLLADSGSTKTVWTIFDKEGIKKELLTEGINPYYQTKEQITNELHTKVLPFCDIFEIKNIYFYGAGCTKDKKHIVEGCLSESFVTARNIEVHSDLLGVGRATCQRESGIVAILGTGSNSALCENGEIVQNISPLGYILGDEGSGAVLGRNLINLLFKNQIDESLKNEFLLEYQTTLPQIIENVYRKPFPNRYLAHFTPFIKKNIGCQVLAKMVENSFDEFLQKNIIQYLKADKLPIHFVGSVAFYFQDILKKVVKNNNLLMGDIVQNPMKGLVSYHLSKN